MIPTGWKVALTADLMTGGHRLHIHRPAGDGQVDIITSFIPDGFAVVDRHDPATTLDFPGFLVPADALDDLVETLKPGPTAAELGRLEAALDLERSRVDRVIDSYLDRSNP